MDLPPSVNHLYGRNKFGSVYLKKEGKLYKEKMIKRIKEEVKNQQWVKCEGEYLFLNEVVFMNKKGRDSDNLKKLMQDCITESGVVWTDDTYCLPKTNRIYIDKNSPRVEIDLTPSGFVGIFNNKTEHDRFIKDFCNNCKKGDKIGERGGCSIYKNIMDNRITDDIKIDFSTGDKSCLKVK